MSGICQNCGSALMENAKFCSSCGSPIPVPIHECPKCGFKDIKDGMNFCPECGYNIRESNSNVAHITKNHSDQNQNIQPQKKITEYITWDYFTKYIDLILSHYQHKKFEKDTLLDKIFEISKNRYNLSSKLDDDLFNIIKVNDNFINSLFKKFDFKYTIYEHFIKNIPRINYNDLLVKEEFKYAQHQAFLNSITMELRKIEIELPQLLSNMQKFNNLTKDIKTRKENSEKKTGLLTALGVGASVITGGLAAPLLAGAGMSWMTDKTTIDQIDKELGNLFQSIKDKSEEIEKIVDSIDEKIDEIVKNGIVNDISPAFCSILNNYIENKAIDEDGTKKYIENYIVSVQNAIENRVKIENAIVKLEKDLDRFKANRPDSSASQTERDRYKKIKKTGYDKIGELKEKLKDNKWYLFQFSLNDIEILNLDDADLEKIIEENKIVAIENSNQYSNGVPKNWKLPANDNSGSETNQLPNSAKNEITIQDESEALLEEIRKYCNSSLFCKGSYSTFNTNKISNYRKNTNEDMGEILIYCDDTVFGGGEDGFALTHEKIYHYCMGAGSGLKYIEIDAVEKTEDDIILSYGEYAWPLIKSEYVKDERFYDLLLQFIIKKANYHRLNNNLPEVKLGIE